MQNNCKRIAITLVDGYHIRFFIETGFVSALADAGNEIILLVPKYHMNEVDSQISKKIKIEELPVEKITIGERILRHLYSGIFRSKHASQRNEFIYRRRKDNSTLVEKIKFGLRYSIEKYTAKLINNAVVVKGLKDLLINKQGTKSIGELIKRIKPDILVSSSPALKYIDIPVVRTCQSYKIPTISPVLSWDNLSSKGPLFSKVDRLIVWNKKMENDAHIQHGYDKKDVVVCGAPQFDIYAKIEKTRLKKELINKQKELLSKYERIITLTSVPTYLYPSIVELSMRILQILRLKNFPYKSLFIIRPHPQQDPSIFNIFKKYNNVKIALAGVHTFLNGSDTEIIWQPGRNNMEELMELMVISDLVITIASTTTLDAAAADTPIINVAYDPIGKISKNRINQLYNTDHYKQIVQSNAIPLVNSDEELEKEIFYQIRNPSNMIDKRRQLVEEICGLSDGKSTQRQIRAIMDFVKAT